MLNNKLSFILVSDKNVIEMEECSQLYLQYRAIFELARLSVRAAHLISVHPAPPQVNDTLQQQQQQQQPDQLVLQAPNNVTDAGVGTPNASSFHSMLSLKNPALIDGFASASSSGPHVAVYTPQSAAKHYNNSSSSTAHSGSPRGQVYNSTTPSQQQQQQQADMGPNSMALKKTQPFAASAGSSPRPQQMIEK